MKIQWIFSLRFWLIVGLLLTIAAMILPPEAFGRFDWFMSESDGLQYRIMLIGVIIIAALTIKYLIFKLRINQNVYDDKIRSLQEVADRLQKLADRQSERLEQTEAGNDVFTKIYREYFETIDTLSVEYFDKQDADTATRLSIVRRLEEEVGRMRTLKFNTSIIEWVNLHNDNILTHISTEVPRLKQTDIVFMALKIAGFSPKSIALLQQLTIGNYYNRITRLKARIQRAEAPHGERLLQLLGKNNSSNQ